MDLPPQDALRVDREEFIHKLKTTLKNDTPVLIRNWTPSLSCEGDSFEDAVYSFFGERKSKVTWQCKFLWKILNEFISNYFDNTASSLALQKAKQVEDIQQKVNQKRTPAKKLKKDLEDAKNIAIHETSSLEEFIQYAKNPEKCGNILDRTNLSFLERPWFIRYVGLTFS